MERWSKDLQKLPLHKSNEKLAKIINIDFFRTLEINQMLAKSKDCLFKKITIS